jgi:hypothetical protein
VSTSGFSQVGWVLGVGRGSGSGGSQGRASVRAGGLRSAGLLATDDLYLLYISENVANKDEALPRFRTKEDAAVTEPNHKSKLTVS